MLPRILFVCVENANRSQMAEAFARMHGANLVDAYSAGSQPAGQINPRAVAAMAEKGYDLSRHRSTGLDDLPEGAFEYVVTMGCGDACPWVPARYREDWAVPDPRDLEHAGFNQVRDDIEARVLDLLHRIRSWDVRSDD